MSLRLAFNCGRWQPNAEQFVVALSMIRDVEERKRICNFAFQKSLKLALIGRLVIRKAIRNVFKLKNNDIILARSEHGRPYLVNDVSCDFDFNLSHEEELVVLAGESRRRVGIDTTFSRRYIGSKSVDNFISLMSRQLTDNEWKWVNSYKTNANGRLINFYRIWCMKESYAKAVGEGIGLSFSRLECCIKEKLPPKAAEDSCSSEWKVQEFLKKGRDLDEDLLAGSNLVTSSYMKVDGVEADGWKFEESVIGPYLVCVAVQKKSHVGTDVDALHPPDFKFLTIEELLQEEEESINGGDDDKTEMSLKARFAQHENDFIPEWNSYIKKDFEPNPRIRFE